MTWAYIPAPETGSASAPDTLDDMTAADPAGEDDIEKMKHLWKEAIIAIVSDYRDEYWAMLNDERDIAKVPGRLYRQRRMSTQVLADLKSYLNSKDGQIVCSLAGIGRADPERVAGWVLSTEQDAVAWPKPWAGVH